MLLLRLEHPRNRLCLTVVSPATTQLYAAVATLSLTFSSTHAVLHLLLLQFSFLTRKLHNTG